MLGSENKASQDHEAKTWTIGCSAPNQNPLLLAQHLGRRDDCKLHSQQGTGSAGGGSGCVSSGIWFGTGAWPGHFPSAWGRKEVGVLGLGEGATPSLASNMD